jgi:hypothetical protein
MYHVTLYLTVKALTSNLLPLFIFIFIFIFITIHGSLYMILDKSILLYTNSAAATNVQDILVVFHKKLVALGREISVLYIYIYI